MSGVRKRLASIIHGNTGEEPGERTGEEPGEQDKAKAPRLRQGVQLRLGIGSRSSGQASASSDENSSKNFFAVTRFFS